MINIFSGLKIFINWAASTAILAAFIFYFTL